MSEDGIERMTFNRVPVKNDIVVLGFTSKAALQPYTVNANVTTPKYMKVNGYQLIKMIQGRLGLRLNWSIDLGCTLSPSQLAGLVAKYGKAVIKVSSPEPI
ncbi:MAG: hypothetical protein EOO85_16420 [Pedobacter sp.]|nr:MAG: hypothetical protein EOO85_16420 [Pedobacter sp.]